MKNVFAIGGLITLAAAAIAGWVMNLYALFHITEPGVTGELALRIVGIFVPVIGAVMGWIP